MAKILFCTKIVVISLKLFCELKNFLGTRIPRSTIISMSACRYNIQTPFHYILFSSCYMLILSQCFWTQKFAVSTHFFGPNFLNQIFFYLKFFTYNCLGTKFYWSKTFFFFKNIWTSNFVSEMNFLS